MTDHKPVMVVTSRRVLQGADAKFEQLMKEMITAAEAFPGHLGGQLIRPGEDSGEGSGQYHVVFAFDTDDHLQVWIGSPQRQHLLAQITPLILGPTQTGFLTGMENWFAFPGASSRPPPPRWKMALVTWLGIFGLVAILSPTITPHLAPIHPLLSIAAVTGLVVIFMTWLVGPALTKTFAKWLYPTVAQN